MDRVKKFIMTTILGGLGVVLPVAIIVYVFYWIFTSLTDIVKPLAELIFERTPVQGLAASALTLVLLVVLCFIIGLSVKSAYGRLFHNLIEDQFLKKIPGYGVVTDTVRYFTDNKEKPFSQVALVRPFGNDTMVTGFITDKHKGAYTVFIPTGPNPTSGNILHIKREYVEIVDIGVDDAMQSIIGAGAGSRKLMKGRLGKAKNVHD